MATKPWGFFFLCIDCCIAWHYVTAATCFEIQRRQKKKTHTYLLVHVLMCPAVALVSYCGQTRKFVKSRSGMGNALIAIDRLMAKALWVVHVALSLRYLNFFNIVCVSSNRKSILAWIVLASLDLHLGL